ncbi:unnamed protein product [Dicrocoelium dendriticum]|nr:unnamed protein product [Dicrocoelium dendriticum]
MFPATSLLSIITIDIRFHFLLITLRSLCTILSPNVLLTLRLIGSLMVAAGCSDQSIRLYQFVDPYKPQLSEVLHAHDDSVNSVAFSHCGLKLASGSSDGGSCWLWRLQAGKWRSLVLSFRKRFASLTLWSAFDSLFAFNRGGGGGGGGGYIKNICFFSGHEGAVHAIAPSPLDDDILATGGVDGRFQLWNIRLHRALVSTESEGSNPNREHEFHPLLCHHRFHPCEFDPEVGLVWHPLGPGEDASIWTYPNGSRRSSQRDQVASSSYHRPGGQTARDSASQGQLGVLPSISGSLRQQRITACRAVPTCEGVGFLVVTKSGLLSVFRPEEASLDSQSFQSQTRPNICDVDEQFFHWELDTAEWKEVCHNTPDLVTRITLALGSPTAPQSVAGLMASRYDRTGRNSRITSGSNVSESRENQSDAGTSRAGTPRNIYRPPPSVCFEIVHAPSKVPFHRLPPPYLTNLRGAPLPPNQQRNVPGRSNLRNQLDLLPSVAIDEEVGAEVVVDDIQFCSNIPSDYCPTPVLCSSRPTPGKQYLWESVWLNGSTPLIDSLSPSDLR